MRILKGSIEWSDFAAAAAAAAKSLQSCPTLCDPIEGQILSLSKRIAFSTLDSSREIKLLKPQPHPQRYNLIGLVRCLLLLFFKVILMGCLD